MLVLGPNLSQLFQSSTASVHLRCQRISHGVVGELKGRIRLVGVNVDRSRPAREVDVVLVSRLDRCSSSVTDLPATVQELKPPVIRLVDFGPRARIPDQSSGRSWH
jgi:hypothetical protein